MAVMVQKVTLFMDHCKLIKQSKIKMTNFIPQ